MCSYPRPLIRVIYTVATRKYQHRYPYLLSVCQSARMTDHYLHRLRPVINCSGMKLQCASGTNNTNVDYVIQRHVFFCQEKDLQASVQWILEIIFIIFEQRTVNWKDCKLDVQIKFLLFWASFGITLLLEDLKSPETNLLKRALFRVRASDFRSDGPCSSRL